MSQWRIEISRRIGYWQDQVYVYRDINTSGGRFLEFMYPDSGGMSVKRIPYNDGMFIDDEVPHFLRMDPRDMEQFLMAWRDAMKNFNLPASDEMRMRGELDATKKHLEDMRLLALPSPTEREAR